MQIARDPFARSTLVRRTVKTPAECAWCGNRARFQYANEDDRVRPVTLAWSRPFCSVGCYRTHR